MNEIQIIDAPWIATCAVCGSDERIVRKVTQWPDEIHTVERWMCWNAVKCNQRREAIRKEERRQRKEEEQHDDVPVR